MSCNGFLRTRCLIMRDEKERDYGNKRERKGKGNGRKE